MPRPPDDRSEAPVGIGRRALAPAGRTIERRGEPEAAGILEAALQATRRDPDRLTHGFHSYPARMHPDLAATLLRAFSRPRTRVLDPFCGSGTLLVEAMVAGVRAAGVDLSPLALRVAHERCALRRRESRRRFEQSLVAVTEASLERVRNRVRVRAALSPQERSFYDAHVLLELAGLLEEIRRVEPVEDREAMEMVFSALLVKFSRQRADTSEHLVARRIRKGLVSEFFQRKGTELVERWSALAQACPPGTPEPILRQGDARHLDRIVGDLAPFDLVVTSPPYGGTYDYAAHHARRHAWLGLDTSALDRDELGARRQLSTGRHAAARWDAEVHQYLQAIAGVCRQGARIALLVGDAELGGGTRIDAADQLLRIAPSLAFVPVAVASHVRPDFRRGAPRREHLALLELAGREPRERSPTRERRTRRERD